ncbi:DUF924 family protein [Coxiella endosymbiont of Rhipicephalus microplus]|uniref:DUF924 family protein n=1 Tax=Coxiella endosymbiont of Rhipicephalus microplus TaxID=1656186 RepID=UPI000C80E728
MLYKLVLLETLLLYKSLFKFDNHHYNITPHFQRFPQDNNLLKRESIPEDIQYLLNNMKGF